MLRGKLLVVEDDVLNLILIKTTLIQRGHTVVEARNGQVALSILDESFDLVLTDIMMPEMDGFTLVEEIRRSRYVYDIPVIMVTALTEKSHRLKAVEVGANDFITKPVDALELQVRTQSLLRQKKQQDEIKAFNAELQARQQAMDEDLRAAAVIQQTLLPQYLPDVPEVDMAWKFIPSSVVGGDIFNVLVLDDTHLGLYILDVSGHGVQSAMVTVAVSQMLNPLSYGVVRGRRPDPPYYHLAHPGEVLQRLDREFPLERFGKFFTMVYAVLNKYTGRMVYSSAGHPPPMVLRTDGTLELLECGGSVVGLGGMIPFDEGVVQLQAGDTLLLYTDGVTEHVNAAGDQYQTMQLMSCLQRWAGSDARTLVEALAADVAALAPEVHFKDDVSLLALQYTIQPGGGV